MNTMLNQTLFAQLQALDQEPAEVCLKVHTYGAEGVIHVSYRKVIHASFNTLQGLPALRAMLELKDCWISEDHTPCKGSGNLNLFIADYLMELFLEMASPDVHQLIETRKIEKRQGHAACSHTTGHLGLIQDYEITLTISGGDWDGHSFELHPGENLLGKAPGVDIFLPEETVSRKHCMILLTDTQARILDLGSLNGTYLNGELINDSVLSPGDELVLGSVAMKVDFTLRRPGPGHPTYVAYKRKTRNIAVAADEKKGPRVEGCKTINWKEFVPKKNQILSKIIHGLKS